MSGTPTIPSFGSMLTVMAGNQCAGFVLRRRSQFEAIDPSGAPIGTFDTVHDAVAVICEATN